MTTTHIESEQDHVSWWKPVLFAALAGGMAWGIRGQYGHETGAMIAGLLVSLVLTFLFCPKAPSLSVARVVAWTTIAMGFGGTMTYGQTIGLSQNPPVLGNWSALTWGMFGLGVKGAIWIGFAGVFLGMGLGGVRYRPLHILGLMVAVVAAFLAGSYLLNAPMDPEHHRLPLVYFSSHWHWEPNTPIADLEPRPESWGGLLLALLVAIAYTGWMRRDGLAWRLALWGMLGGALGFPGGQCLQAFHAWNPDTFHQGIWIKLDPHMNWWNMMETTFGTIMGAALGLGTWIHRRRIQPGETEATASWPAFVGILLMAIHLGLLGAVEFLSNSTIEAIYDLGLIMGIIPMVAVAGGRWWPYLMALPITLMPIAGKTVKELVYDADAIGPVPGWMLYFVVPMAVMIVAALWLARDSKTGRQFTKPALLLATWTYFLLNFAFFRFPWPWAEWTGRTPNGIIFTVCALGLTALALFHRSAETDKEAAPQS